MNATSAYWREVAHRVWREGEGERLVAVTYAIAIGRSLRGDHRYIRAVLKRYGRA